MVSSRNETELYISILLSMERKQGTQRYCQQYLQVHIWRIAQYRKGISTSSSSQNLKHRIGQKYLGHANFEVIKKKTFRSEFSLILQFVSRGDSADLHDDICRENVWERSCLWQSMGNIVDLCHAAWDKWRLVFIVSKGNLTDEMLKIGAVI